MNNQILRSIFFRYFTLILVAFPNFLIFYFLFTPLTLLPLEFLLNLFYGASQQGNVFIIGLHQINLIKACVAGSAYYLLFVLTFSVPGLLFHKRLKVFFFGAGIFLVLNILRILLLTFLLLNNPPLFNIFHQIFWYLLSTVFVLVIWFLEIRIFQVKAIPFYTDFKFIYSLITK